MTRVEKDFIELVKRGAGLSAEAHLSSHPDWEAIYRMAEGHAVLGILAEGISDDDEGAAAVRERLWEDSVEIVRQNKLVNEVLGHVVGYLRKNGVETLLQKGQGVAQCYPNPLLRMSGDIDLLVREEDFEKAKDLLRQKIPFIEEDHYFKDLHSSFLCGEVEIELHATEFGSRNQETRERYRVLCQEMFREGNFRSYECEGVAIRLAPATFDAFYIFLHLVKHYYLQGIGFRQMLDLCLFLKTNDHDIDYDRINAWTEEFGLQKEWVAFTDVWHNELLVSLVVRHGNMGKLKFKGLSRHFFVRGFQIILRNYLFARRHLPFSRRMFVKEICKNYINAITSFWNHRINWKFLQIFFT